MKAAALAMLALVPVQLWAADKLTYDQMAAFLRKAKIVKAKDAKKGVTGTVVVTMTDGTITHDASVQRIDEYQSVYQTDDGNTELNFRDSYRYNIAGWKLARLLGLGDMVPVSVQRSYQGTTASFTWWIDDVMMDEVDRTHKKIDPPNINDWNKEVNVMHVFDQLIYNSDPNETNQLIDKQWHLWMIDHSRSFRLNKKLQNPKVLLMCDRQLLAKMKQLDKVTLQREMKDSLNKPEIDALLARRDLIVKFFESKGDSALFDRPVRD